MLSGRFIPKTEFTVSIINDVYLKTAREPTLNTVAKISQSLAFFVPAPYFVIISPASQFTAQTSTRRITLTGSPYA